jgi:periplasmic divalent cation tolerance protein
MPPLLAVFTSVGEREAAQRLARLAVERRLAACAQISSIDSVYRWQGALCEEAEFRVLFKTTQEVYPQLEAMLLAEHPYTLPAIHATALHAVHAPYAQWVADSVGDG